METNIKEVKIYFKDEDKPFILDYEDLGKFLECDPYVNYRSKNHVYLTLWKKRRLIDFTRVLLNYYKRDLIVDHINRNTRDYRKVNLELKNKSENNANRNKTLCKTSSKFKGVYWNKINSKWIANLKFYGRVLYLGSFDSELEAAKAYDEWFIKLYKTEHGTNKSLGLL